MALVEVRNVNKSFQRDTQIIAVTSRSGASPR